MEFKNVQQVFQDKLNEIQGRIPVRLGIGPSFQTFLSAETNISDNKTATDSNAGASVFDSVIREAAEAYGVDFSLVKAVIDAESSFNPKAVSSAGAMGLMQLMPGTAKALGVSNPYDPRENIEGGVRYLKGLLERFQNNEELALAAYNAGPGRVKQYGGIPPFKETQAYVQRVLEKRKDYNTG